MMNVYLLRNFSSSVFLLLSNFLFVLFFLSYFVKSFGVEEVGFINIAIQMLAGLILLSSGLTTVLVRELTKNKQSALVFRSYLLSRLKVSIVVISFFSIAFFYFNKIGSLHFFCICISFIYHVRVAIILSSFMSESKFYYVNFIQSFIIFGRVFLFFFLMEVFPSHQPSLIFSFSILFVSFLSYLFVYTFFKGKLTLNLNYRGLDINYINYFWSSSKYLVINSLGSAIVRNLDLLLINLYVSIYAAGVYSMYLQMFTLIRLLVEALCNPYLPKIVKHFSSNPKISNSSDLYNDIVKVLFFTSILTSGTAVSVSLFWSYWVGSNLELNIYFLQFVLVANYFSVVFYFCNYVLVALDFNKYLAILSVTTAAIFIGCFYMLKLVAADFIYFFYLSTVVLSIKNIFVIPAVVSLKTELSISKIFFYALLMFVPVSFSFIFIGETEVFLVFRNISVLFFFYLLFYFLFARRFK